MSDRRKSTDEEGGKAALMNWHRAKRDALNLVKDLPDYTHEMILEEYSSLVEALKQPSVRTLMPKQRAFEMQKKFPRFAIAYSSLFMLACHRENPMPVEAVEDLLRTVELQKCGIVEEGKAHGMAMDIAEKYRRMRDA
jgi:hypothetical protein